MVLTKLSIDEDHILSKKIRTWMSMMYLSDDTDWENIELLGKINLSHCKFFYYKF
jgi:hypothetical protein